MTVAAAPYWSIAAVLAAWPLAVLFTRVARRRAKTAGLCPTCGYDLRATPDRCPECGRATNAVEA